MTIEKDADPGEKTEPAAGSPAPLPPITLDQLPGPLREAVRRAGWQSLLPVQTKAIPYLLAGRDLMVQSRTGTGKTAAFVLPILARIDPREAHCQAIVLVPTRELARQVCADSEQLAAGTGIRSVAVYGGVGYDEQLRALREGAHLVVGTPGRILDHLMQGALILDRVKFLVFDAADRMLSVGFYPDMVRMAAYLPEERDGYMFSATYPPRVRSIAKEFLREPEFMSLSHDSEHVAETDHVYYEVPAMDKDRCLVRIIEIENPESAIIFCNTKAAARFASVVLRRFGYDAAQLSADLSQRARDAVLARVYDKKLRFLVATDVAARGIDITGLSHVFLYDFPEDPEMYIHRTGRTGRAGARGEAISLVDVLEKMKLDAVAREYGIDMLHRPLPTDEDVQAIVTERVTALLEAKLRDLDGLVRERMGRMMPLVRSFGDSDSELAVVAMLLDEYYQSVIHAMPDLPPLDDSPMPSTTTERGQRKGRSGRRRRRG